MTKTLLLEIPEDVLESVKLPPDEIEKELRQELALALYKRGVLSSGKARVLAQMTRWQFEMLLGQRRIPRHYSVEDLEEDIQYAQSHQ
ncbi:MAG: UPF0175 family protein [Anaerolineales bacterium]|nr:UPF0175 family protein [Anaerolineales bacterium]